MQALSGTGSLRLGFEFLKKHYPNKTVYLPDPTWGKITEYMVHWDKIIWYTVRLLSPVYGTLG